MFNKQPQIESFIYVCSTGFSCATNVANYLNLFSYKELCQIAHDLGIPTPDCVFTVPKIIKIEKTMSLDRKLEDTLKALSTGKGSAEAVGKACSFCEEFLCETAKSFGFEIEGKGLGGKAKSFFIKENTNKNNKETQENIECKIIDNMINTLYGIAELRNKCSTAHGGTGYKLLDDENLAMFVINQIATICYFVRNKEIEKEAKTNTSTETTNKD